MSEPSSKISVLIVDDDADLLKSLKTGFERKKFSVATAKSGNEAIKILKDNGLSTNVVVTDIRMSDGSGIELLNWICLQKKSQPIVLCMSGYSDLTIGDSYSRGADAYFNKPVDAHTLISAAKHFFETKKSQEKNQQTISLQNEKMASLGQLAGGIAHEINTPLSVIVSYAHLLNELLRDSSLSAEQQKNKMVGYIKKICDTADLIDSIVRSLQAYSRDSEKDPFKNEKVEKIVLNTVSLCQSYLKRNCVSLKLGRVPENLKISCRFSQICQVLVNLVNNACDAIKDLENKWIAIEVEERDQDIDFVITDSGTGIPEQIREQIFQPFFTTKDTEKGTGLGLSISQKIAEDHQGSIEYDEDFHYTRFAVTIPKAQE